MNREPWHLVIRSDVVVIYRGRSRKCVDAMDALAAMDRGGALLMIGLSAMDGHRDLPAVVRAGWRIHLYDGLVHVYRHGPAKCLDVMTPSDAVDEGGSLLLAGEAIRATTPLISRDKGVQP